MLTIEKRYGILNKLSRERKAKHLKTSKNKLKKLLTDEKISANINKLSRETKNDSKTNL